METVGRYRLEALIGRGTTGAVWRGTRRGAVAQVVAVKRARADGAVDPVAADRLRREAAVLAGLDHPHIVRILDVLDDGDGIAIVMPLARGGSLHDLLAERGRLAPGATVAVLSRVADAAGSAHRHGVLHGDVKPANILFTSDGEPLLGDFGVAQHLLPGRTGGADLVGLVGLVGGAGGAEGADRSRSVVEGTVGYVDPQLVATGVPEPRNDVYGLGVVAYLCLAGRLPHAGADAATIHGAAEAGDHPPLGQVPGVPPGLATVVESALARDPEDRPATAEALARALRAAVPAGTIVLPGTPLHPHGRRDHVDDEGVRDGDRAHGDPGGPDGDGVDEQPPDGDGADGDGADEQAHDGEVRSPSRGTRAFGPRPAHPPGPADRRHPVLAVAAVLVVLAAAGAGGLWARDRLDEARAPRTVAVAGGRTPAAVACPDPEPIEVPPGAVQLSGDLDGDGCPTPVVWNGRVMRFRTDEGETRPRSYDFRLAGDRTPGQLLLGDWDCDGTDTPALYRPADGVVAYFDAVPGRVGGEVTATPEPTGVIGGRARLEPGDGDRCDTVAVSPEA